MGRSFTKVLYLLASFEFEDFFKSLEKQISSIDFSSWISGKSFRVTCKRIGQHEFSSEDVVKKAGELILRSVKARVDLDNPDTVVYVYILKKNYNISILKRESVKNN